MSRSLLKSAAALAAALTAAACSGDVTAPPMAAGAPSRALGMPGTTSTIASRLSPAQCIDAAGGAIAAGTAITLWSCHDGANQQFTWTDAGELRAGDLCLDVWGAVGNDGDKVVLWPCHGGANQRWALGSNGELRGVNGRCLDIPGGDTSNGVQLIVWECHGNANQLWQTRGGSAAAPPPAPAPVPSPAPVPGRGQAAVLDFVGAIPGVGSVEALGGVYARYEQDFRSYADRHWANEGASVDANSYDRAMIYYVWWARTGNQTYLDRANALALNYRQNFLEARGFDVLPYEAFVEGIAVHYLVTGDEASRAAVGRVADRFASSRFVDVLSNPDGEVENRDQSRVLTALVVARVIGAPTATGTDWAARARTALTNILASQSADGAYRFTSGSANQCGQNKPWMVGLLNDALIRYYTHVEPDARIPGSVRRAVDYIWANDWRADQQAIVYIGGDCNGQSPDPSADLNGLVVSGFGFVYRETGDDSYRARGEQLFAGAVNGGWPAGSKQFNQQYTSSFRFLRHR